MIDEARPNEQEVQHAVASLSGPAAELWTEMLGAATSTERLRWTDSDEHDRRLADLGVIPEAGAAAEDDGGDFWCDDWGIDR